MDASAGGQYYYKILGDDAGLKKPPYWKTIAGLSPGIGVNIYRNCSIAMGPVLFFEGFQKGQAAETFTGIQLYPYIY